MGQHKTNPTAILAKQGKIPPKRKNESISKGLLEEYVFSVMYRRMFGLNTYKRNGR